MADEWGDASATPELPDPADLPDQAGDGRLDERLRSELAAMWEHHDSAPGGLVERVLVALATEDIDVDYELLHLVARTSELAGARGVAEALTISFAGGEFSLLLRISPLDGGFRRVDGWVSPPRPLRVRVEQRRLSVDAEVDSRGRFEMPRVRSGGSRFWLLGRESADDEHDRPLFATPTVEI